MKIKPEPAYIPGTVVLIKGDKRKWLVPDQKDYPNLCDWAPRNCIDCSNHGFGNEDREMCFEYVLMELDQLDLPTGKITTHICERRIKIAK